VYVLGYVGFLADTPLKTARVQGVIDTLLAVGAALAACQAYAWLRTRSRPLFADPAGPGTAAAVIGGIVIIAFGQTAVRDIPYLDEQRATRYPKQLLEGFERSTRGEYVDEVVLTDVTDLNTFLPTYTFTTSRAHFAHPAALFNDRADFLTRLAAERDPDVFELALLHNRYDSIDLIALRPTTGGLGYRWSADAFPRGPEDRSITFPLSSFTGKSFVPIPNRELTMYRVDRSRDPRRAMERCPEQPTAPNCAVLRRAVARYAGDLDDDTVSLASKSRRRR
jgi:hypothetical protein